MILNGIKILSIDCKIPVGDTLIDKPDMHGLFDGSFLD